jgi:hypothetical protein
MRDAFLLIVLAICEYAFDSTSYKVLSDDTDTLESASSNSKSPETLTTYVISPYGYS